MYSTKLHTTNAGITWTAQSSGTALDLQDVSAVDANTAWAVGTTGTILKTINGGTTWTAQSSGTTNGLFDVSAVDANTAWAVGLSGTIRYTTDAGTTWNAQTSGTTQGLRGVSAVDASTAWAVGELGVLLHTTNAGTTWTAQTSGTTTSLFGVSAVDVNTAFVTGDVGTILYTTDGGITWTAQSSGTTNVLFSVSAVDASTAWAVGNLGTILYGLDTSILTGSVTITGVCEVDLASGTLSFVAGDPIANGAGVGTGEISEVLTNTLGNLQSSTSVFGTDWTDGGALTIMDGSHTVVATSTGNFASKTALSTSSGSPTALGNIAPQGTITTFWDVEIVMDGGNPGYSGATVQTITIDFSCV